VSVEIGEGLAIVPRAKSASSDNGSAGALTTFGTLGLTLVL